MRLPALTDRDRRTLRFAAIGLGLYLAVFGGWQSYRFLTHRHSEYEKLRVEAKTLRSRLELYNARAARVEKLMESFRMDPAHLAKTTLVARTGAALQQSAAQGGIQLGPIRETLNRGNAHEVGSFQLEASGPVPAVMTFLHRLHGLGFPVVIDTLQFSSDPRMPGMIKVSLGLILLDYDQWDKPGQGAPNV